MSYDLITECLAPTANTTEYLHGKTEVTARPALGEMVEFDVTWPNADPLDRQDLYSLLNVLSPSPGTESIQQVKKNWGGVHEDGEFNQRVMELHRERFGDAWRYLAASRRLLLTVLEGPEYKYHIGWDASLFVDEYAVISGEALDVRPDYFLPALARKIQYSKKTELSPDLLRAKDMLGAAARRDKPDYYRRGGAVEYLAEIYASRHEVRDRLADVLNSVTDSLAQNPEAADFLKRLAIETAFDSFIANDGERYWVDMTSHHTEVGISLQEHYNQRRIVFPYSYQQGRLGYKIELPNGLDEPDLLGVADTATADTQQYQFEYDVSASEKLPTIKPILRWHGGDNRSFAQNQDLDVSETKTDGPAIIYADTLVGKMIMAASCPEIRARWPKTYRLAQGTFTSGYGGSRDFRRINVGEAQVPLLVLMSEGQLAVSQAIDELEKSVL